ncbi:MAG TPA: tRNA lysidine(34) synthetase TilS, partial [Planctomycetaceae bacterium]|nr:tRNA lysidine(34) synthetase TilS [Planctomycetaceae bacterium]
MRGKDDFLSLLRRALEEHSLIQRRLAIGVSGGADSTALLRGLVELAPPLELELVAIHVDHGLRGEQSRADAEWTEELCRRLDVPFECRRVDVGAWAEQHKVGLEEAARWVRYDLLEEVALSTGCSHLAVAQTADDQAETILHHILRGTGLSGLRGILP